MLKFVLKDIDGNVTRLKRPVKVSIVSSEDAPADSLVAVFAVNGTIPVLDEIEVYHEGEMAFEGKVDCQITDVRTSGKVLTVKARSRECILLDNEALPQTYCMPSMGLLMKRHFVPLGFTKYMGSDQAFNGELDVTKGMSEWAVLKTFCVNFLHTVPRLRNNRVIDVSGDESEELVCVSSRQCLSVRKTLNRSSVISDIYARTYRNGGYEMPLVNPSAHRLGIHRKRYVNSVDSKSRTVLSAKELLQKSNRQYEQWELEYSGCILCERGAKLILDGKDQHLRVRELHYYFDQNGEKTKIFAEVREK